MAPTKEKNKLDDNELQEEAMAEWLSRGLAMKDFTMEKMLKLWMEEEGGDEDEELDGEEALTAKQELIESFNVLQPYVEQAKEMAQQLKRVVKEEAKNTLATAWKYAELPPLQRRRLLREHVVNVHEMDREAHKYFHIKQRFVEEFEEAKQADAELQFGLKKRNKHRAPLLYRSKEMKLEADKEQQARILADIEQKRRERMDQELQKKQRQRAEKEQFVEDQRVYRRHMNMKFWKKQLADAQAFSEQQTFEQDKQKDFNDRVERMRDEIQQMNDQEVHDSHQQFDRHVTTSSIGIFDTSFEPGEWNSAINGGYQSGMDDATVGISTARGFIVENELRHIKLMEVQSKVAMLQQKLEEVEVAKTNLSLDQQTIFERKDKLMAEIAQIRVEHDDLSESLAGPPRRDPNEIEKMQIHELISHRAVFVSQLKDLTAREANIKKRMQILMRSETSFQALLIEAREKQDELQECMNEIDKERHNLPMVVGRSIFRTDVSSNEEEMSEQALVQVTVPIQNPARLLSQVTLASKFEILKDDAAPVKNHYQKAKGILIESWKMNEQKTLMEHELEATKTRLANVRDRFIEQERNSLRADLVNAIRRFHQGPHKLRQCILPVKGQFLWWEQRIPSKCMGLCCDENLNHIRLTGDHSGGKVTGCVRLPKNCLYRIQLSIKIATAITGEEVGAYAFADDEEKCEMEDMEDCKVYIGSEFDALQHHVFRDLSGKIIRSGDQVFEFFGTRLCFSFEFTTRSGSRTGQHRHQYVVDNVGKFEERIEDFREEESRIRLAQKEKHFVSELVKTIRMQAAQTSSDRCAKLLQELYHVEKSRNKTWDSSLLHGYQQRFKRVDYANMLRGEIKKEIACQIDQAVASKKGRAIDMQTQELGTLETTVANAGVSQRDISRLQFQARKSALIEPRMLKIKHSLGNYCSFRSSLNPSQGSPTETTGSNDHLVAKKAASLLSTHAIVSCQKESMTMGVRFEWSEAKTKLYVLHKLCISSAESNEPRSDFDAIKNICESVQTEWCQVENANTVFLSSACAKLLSDLRQGNAKARALLEKKDEQIHQLQLETAKVMAKDQEAVLREAKEDEILQQQKQHELERRKQLLYTDGIRLTTYSENVSSQIDFLVMRRVAVETQNERGEPVQMESIVQDVKEQFAQKYAEGRLALVKKTWERKEKRIAVKREKERREREFRIKQEQQLTMEITESSQQELSALQIAQDQLTRARLNIPNFDLAVKGIFPCEHIELKAWGTKYSMGLRCKNCGKEMSNSAEDSNQVRGADPELDRDVQLHRSQTTSGIAMRFKNAEHLNKVENERIRLEKERRMLELSEALLYDRMAPKVIDEFNYRHGVNRDIVPDMDAADPLYPRLVHEIHHASFQDEILFYGRLKNFRFRILQIAGEHSHCCTLLAVQRDFLDNIRLENDIVLSKLPLIERDHARAEILICEDLAALKRLDAAKNELVKSQKERDAAYHAIEGSEEEAQFAEFHAPSLIRNSQEMAVTVQRMREELNLAQCEASLSREALHKAATEKAKTEGLLSRLYCRIPKSLFRTRFGFAEVIYYRTLDDCVVLNALQWRATFVVPVDELILYEAMLREEESLAMACEDRRCHEFYRAESEINKDERTKMGAEEALTHKIVAWRTKKAVEESFIRTSICKVELDLQVQYELDWKRQNRDAADAEAKKFQQITRVSLHRRTKIVRPQPARLDILRVTRACEKRLAMSHVEQIILRKDTELRQKHQQERDSICANRLKVECFDDLLESVIKDLSDEALHESIYAAKEMGRINNSTAIGSENLKAMHAHCYTGLDRVWIARRKQYGLLLSTWRQELFKLHTLRQEIARREEIQRLEEHERFILETRRKEMLAEERWRRTFDLEEMVLYVREQKAMANAELEMREYMRQLEIEATKAKYAKMVEDRNHGNDRAARRLEIKLGKNEKHRLHREWVQIREEDELATQIREREIAQKAVQALERQFDKYLVQQAMDGRLAADIEANNLAERLREAQRIAAEQRAAFEAKLVQERMMVTVETFHTLAEVEVNWMDANERMTFWQRKLVALETNLSKLEPELQRISSEREHVVADANAKRNYAEMCKKRVADADEALAKAIKNEELCQNAYKRIHRLNSTMDSEVIHNRVQRFKTIYLKEQLHEKYFSLLTDSIIRRAIVECNEREAVRLEEKIRRLEDEQVIKTKEVKVLQRQHRRGYRMRLRRSELGKLMFGVSQRRLLNEKFQRWVKLWSQSVMVRSSFELKNGLMLQKKKLEEQINPKKKLLRDSEEAITKLSILHDFQKRRLQCRLCKQEYSEEQNNQYACSYHPGPYELACIKSCSTRKANITGSSLATASCMIHRAKRWLCCDETEEGRYGSTGCARRFHLPIRSNPSLEALVLRKTKEEETVLEEINRQLLELHERDVVGKMKAATKSGITKIEQGLREKRAIAAKYHSLDRR